MWFHFVHRSRVEVLTWLCLSFCRIPITYLCPNRPYSPSLSCFTISQMSGAAPSNRPAFWDRKLVEARPLQFFSKEGVASAGKQWNNYTQKYWHTMRFRGMVHYMLGFGLVGHTINKIYKRSTLCSVCHGVVHMSLV